MISVLMPALNEEGQLRRAVEDVLTASRQAGSVVSQVIIVNDGSSDGTGRIAQELASQYAVVEAVHHRRNRGLAYTVKEVLPRVRGEKFISVPGSGDMDRLLLVQLFRHHRTADAVFAYYVNREIRKRPRALISALVGMMYMVSFDIFIQYVTGPALYPTALVRTFQLRSYGFSIYAEMTVKVLRSGGTYAEVAGWMNPSAKRSGTISWKNFVEVVVTYLSLFGELHLWRRGHFRDRGRRVKAF